MVHWIAVFSPAAAEIFVLAMVGVIMLAGLFGGQKRSGLTYNLAQITLVVAAIISWQSWQAAPVITFSGHFINDSLAVLLKEFVYIMVLLLFVYSRHYIKQQKIMILEFYLLALLSLAGAQVLISANSLLTLYIGMELMSLPLYAMVAMRRDVGLSSEAAMKYFIMGGLSSAILLYGMSLLYGASQSLFLPEITAHIAAMTSISPVVVLALVLIIAGIAFKFAAVPFHMWAPDVYQGAPTVVSALISTVPKIAALALLARLVAGAFGSAHVYWQSILQVLAVLSLLIGNILAVVQTNIKRLLAYSTIANMGFVLLAFATHTLAGWHAAVFYTIVYALMSAGAFGLLIMLSRGEVDCEHIEDLAGLNMRNSWLALLMLIIMLSLVGVPPMLGFSAKLLVIMSLIKVNSYYLAGFALVMAVIGAYYYFKIVKAMYFDSPQDEKPVTVSYDGNIVLSINALALLVFGLLPFALMHLFSSAI